jgi:hypothetical protein
MTEILLGIVIGFALMMVLRPFFLWYWKVYDVVDKQDALIETIKMSQKEILHELKEIKKELAVKAEEL